MTTTLLRRVEAAVEFVHQAVGPPGDYGYGTQVGIALSTLYSLRPELDAAVEAEKAAAKKGTEENTPEWALVTVADIGLKAGRISEEERFGVMFLRIDIPVDGDAGRWATSWHTPPKVLSIETSDEASVMRLNAYFAHRTTDGGRR